MSHAASHDYADPTASPRHCQNCGAKLTGPYCSNCGQADIDYHRSFHHLFHDLLENLFHFEGKFFVTVAWLLAKPGQLTREFVAGRRQSQLNPLRLYLFVSVLFFLSVSLLNHGHIFALDSAGIAATQKELAGNFMIGKGLTKDLTREERQEVMRRFRKLADRGEITQTDVTGVFREIRAEVLADRAKTAGAPHDGEQRRAPVVEEDHGLGGELMEKFESGEITLPEIVESLEHRVPSLFFLGVPLYALLLKLVYVRSKRYYIEHLIFSLHLHTWAFLALLVGNGYVKLAGLASHRLASWVGWLLLVWAIWYVFRAFRVVYGQSRGKTATKILLLASAHACVLLLVAIALFALTLTWFALE